MATTQIREKDVISRSTLAGIIFFDKRVDAESTVRQTRRYITTNSIEVAAETSRHTPVVVGKTSTIRDDVLTRPQYQR